MENSPSLITIEYDNGKYRQTVPTNLLPNSMFASWAHFSSISGRNDQSIIRIPTLTDVTMNHIKRYILEAYLPIAPHIVSIIQRDFKLDTEQDYSDEILIDSDIYNQMAFYLAFDNYEILGEEENLLKALVKQRIQLEEIQLRRLRAHRNKFDFNRSVISLSDPSQVYNIRSKGRDCNGGEVKE